MRIVKVPPKFHPKILTGLTHIGVMEGEEVELREMMSNKIVGIAKYEVYESGDDLVMKVFYQPQKTINFLKMDFKLF